MDDVESTYVIREIYESENSAEAFMLQLERALHTQYKYIVIEPKRLADETSRWILMGNTISQLSAVTGLASIATCVFAPQRLYVSVPLAGTALVLRGFYDISWNFDPCSKYQVASSRNLNHLKEADTKSATRILVYKDNTLLNFAFRTVTVSAIVLCGLQLYRNLK